MIEKLADGLLLVAEISEDIAQAIQTDMVLEPRLSALSFRCMVRGGNVFQTTSNHLKTFAGLLPPPLTEKVVEFCRSAEDFDSDVPLSEYKFGRDPNGTVLMHRKGVTSGMLVTQDEDSRLNHLAAAKQQCSYLSREN